MTAYSPALAALAQKRAVELVERLVTAHPYLLPEVVAGIVKGRADRLAAAPGRTQPRGTSLPAGGSEMTNWIPRAAEAPTPPALSPRAARGLTPVTGDREVSPVTGYTLTSAELDLVIEALDAAAEDQWSAGADCARCAADPLGPLCDDHATAKRKGIRYASLAGRLAKAAGRD